MNLLKWPGRKVPAEDSSQLQTLLDSLSDVVMVIDHAQQISSVNASWERITGYPRNDTLQRTFADFLHPEDIPLWNRLFTADTRTVPGPGWLRLLHHSGEIRWCEMRLQPINPPEPYPLSATLCDITPQVRNEQTRDASHRSLQSLVDRLPAMLYRSRNNASWTMEYVSSGCELLTGYPAESLLNQSQISLGSMIHPNDADYVWEAVQAALQSQQSFDLEYRLTRADGVQIRVRDKGCGLYSESGMVLGVEGIILECH
ncbi:PAS domain-containing protein [Neptuniibacter halophilus]|uniref:PAS domain-containing protein n=1 Tax=Neptuniibacter halophilus TaxID=651666 RepID=UPI00257433C6|nr:PAS domain-containing protein [Neptuniibacter halophilus]